MNKDIVEEKPQCPTCQQKDLKEENSVEVGNIFSLGTKYAEALGLEYVDKGGKRQPVVMGSYGIGPGRLMGTAVELSHDDKGIIWPSSIAPFQIHLLSLPGGETEAEKLYQQLTQEGIEVLHDDRESSPGEKLVDADLLGIPWRIVVSEKTVAANSVEIKRRNEGNAKLVQGKDLRSHISF